MMIRTPSYRRQYQYVGDGLGLDTKHAGSISCLMLSFYDNGSDHQTSALLGLAWVLHSSSRSSGNGKKYTSLTNSGAGRSWSGSGERKVNGRMEGHFCQRYYSYLRRNMIFWREGFISHLHTQPTNYNSNSSNYIIRAPSIPSPCARTTQKLPS